MVSCLMKTFCSVAYESEYYTNDNLLGDFSFHYGRGESINSDLVFEIVRHHINPNSICLVFVLLLKIFWRKML